MTERKDHTQSRRSAGAVRAWLATGLCVLGLAGCAPQRPPAEVQTLPSAVAVTVHPGGPITLKTQTAEFEVAASGYIRAARIADGKRLTLDDPESAATSPGGHVVIGGVEFDDFKLDFTQAKTSDAEGKLGGRGKRIEIPGRSASDEASGLAKTLTVEVYDDFPNLAVTTVSYKNTGPTEVSLDQAVEQRHRLNASLSDAKEPPYRLWSFQGSSEEWGKDEVLVLTRGFTRANVMGAMNPDGLGGGIPVVAFWTATVGEAIGHLEPLPLVVSLPVRVEKDGRVSTSILMDAKVTLKPGEVFSMPRSFVAVYAGDFYEPLRMYSMALQRQGWTIPRPTNESYNASWCSWGYEFDVTPAQMLGTVPKLKELGIKWATLDDRWFENYGDWEPRADTFPGDAIQRMVEELHKQGILVQIWWLPLGAEDGQGKYSSHAYKVSKVVQEHPDWLVLDKNGKPARMARRLATLCPALKEVQEYHRRLTQKFIRDWGFDGHKLDNIFSVPACYNAKHNHRSPNDSIQAMGEVYRVIFETTRALKPDSVTQSCPCGTTPNIAWLSYMDQAVTADPVGAAQVRRRIKMYKALLGPEAPVYGDHVELTEMRRVAGQWAEVGMDFASTVGTGGVVGTKFSWPDYAGRFHKVLLTPEKESHWKKWFGIYNAKMLSRGTFLNLYTLGYDIPEGYAISKGGKMYYAFFSPDPGRPWQGEIELRGLEPGRYRVTDFIEGRELGSVTAPNARLAAEFTHSLLLEASRL